jgi:hypothetical protein
LVFITLLIIFIIIWFYFGFRFSEEPGELSGIALGYGVDDRWFEYRQRLGIFLFTTASRPALEPTLTPIQWVSGAFFLGVNRPRREADHSPPPSVEVRNAWSYTSSPHYAFMAW